MVPLCQKRMLAFRKAWMLHSRPSWAAFIALWAARGYLHLQIWSGDPLMLTLPAMPVSWLVAFGKDHVRAMPVLGSVPISCNAGSLGGKGVVLAEFSARALWTSAATASASNICLPLMQVPIRTVIALPPDFSTAEFLDDKSPRCRLAE